MTPADASILVTHPGAAHFVYECAAAAQKISPKAWFETGFYYDSDGLLAKLLALAPAGLRGKLERELKRRHFAGLDPKRVIQRPLAELVYVAAARQFAHKPEIPRRLMRWRNDRLDAANAASVLAKRPDLVLVHDTGGLQTIRAAKKTGAVSVLNQMIGHVLVGSRILKEESARHPLWADSMGQDTPDWLVELCLQEAREADWLFAPSPYVRDTLIEAGAKPERVRILPFGVRVDRFKPTEKPRDDGVFRLLYVGQISQRKGLDYALQAMRKLNDKRIELVLVGGLVGEGRGLAAHDGWFRHVRNVPHHEVQALFQSADAFIYPSLHEGSALAIIEAMGCGLPCVVTPNAGSLIRDGEDGFIIPIRDVDALVEKITTLRDDPELRARMGAAARAHALEYSWDAYRPRLEALLTETLADR